MTGARIQHFLLILGLLLCAVTATAQPLATSGTITLSSQPPVAATATPLPPALQTSPRQGPNEIDPGFSIEVSPKSVNIGDLVTLSLRVRDPNFQPERIEEITCDLDENQWHLELHWQRDWTSIDKKKEKEKREKEKEKKRLADLEKDKLRKEKDKERKADDKEKAKKDGGDAATALLNKFKKKKEETSGSGDGSATLPKKLAAPVLQKTVRKHRRRFAGCSKLLGDSGPKTVTLAITVKGTGRVASARVASSGGASGNVQSCLVRVARGVKFPKFQAAQQSFRYPIRLQ